MVNTEGPAALVKKSLREKLEALFREKPLFHGRENAGSEHYAISSEVLRWMFDTLEPGGVTLETGCGYSTVVFSLLSNRHIAISPFPQEHHIVRQWLLSHRIPVDHIEFISLPSQEAVHSLDFKYELEMVLIDGDHAFPAPFIDWYYTADKLKTGGYVIVDDTQLITGKILRDFLLADNERWKSIQEIGKTSIFKKMIPGPVAKGIPWIKQPFVNVNIKK